MVFGFKLKGLMMKCMKLIILLCLFWSFPAYAQSDVTIEEDNRGEQFSIISSVSSASSSSIFFAATTAIKSRENELEEGIEQLRKVVMIQRFMLNNERQFQMGLVIGNGAVLCETLTLVDSNVKLTQSMSKNLRKKRSDLRVILQQPSSFERAGKIYTILKDIIESDDVYTTQELFVLNKKGEQ